MPALAWRFFAAALGLAALFACAARGAPAPLPKAPPRMPAARGYGDGEPDFAEAWAKSEILRRFAPLDGECAWANYQVARARLEWLEAGEALWLNPFAWYAVKRDQERRKEAWHCLAQLLRQERAYPGSAVAGEWPACRLKEMIGEEAFAAGTMPDPLPWWTFRRAD